MTGSGWPCSSTTEITTARIGEMIQNDRRVTLLEISSELGLSYGSMQHIVSDVLRTATAGLDVVQSGRPIFDDFFQHLWPYIGNNTVNVVFQMVKHLWLIRIDQ
ncbi:hypothetical protein TNCV_224371 [Trichonephila clavipes]|nr:hypothetical protein TNCV_224371 [Trichonephila clavipes]